RPGQAWRQLRDAREQAFPMGHDAPMARVRRREHGEPEGPRVDPFADRGSPGQPDDPDDPDE
ncbi:MAG: hypothetical protein KDI03_23170, partial [Anaerolineae bacterium]|nr:hypothetical protein [Anaerolineae bacterium]